MDHQRCDWVISKYHEALLLVLKALIPNYCTTVTENEELLGRIVTLMTEAKAGPPAKHRTIRRDFIPQLCTRTAYHDGPCNGWPAKTCPYPCGEVPTNVKLNEKGEVSEITLTNPGPQ